jgi:HEAT repeat protein
MMWTAAFVLALLASDDKEAEDAIQKFKSVMKSPEVSIRAEAVRELGKTQHEKVLKVLGACLVTDDKNVRIAAAKSLGLFQERKHTVVAVLSEALGPNAKEVDVVAALLGALQELHEQTALSVAYRYLEDKNEKVAVAAIGITGAARSRTSIDPLIKLMKKVQNLGDGISSGGNGGNGGYDVPPDERIKEWAKQLNAAATKALTSITGEKFGPFAEWDGWWKRNGATFKVKE